MIFLDHVACVAGDLRHTCAIMRGSSRLQTPRIEGVVRFEPCARKVEMNMSFWMASLGLQKVFDRIVHDAVFTAFTCQGVEDNYLERL